MVHTVTVVKASKLKIYHVPMKFPPKLIHGGPVHSCYDGMAECLSRETTEPGVLGPNPAQVSDWAGTLVALYKCEGLFVVL